MKNLIKCYCGHTTTCDCIDILELVQIPEEPKQHVELINDNIEEFDKAIKLFKQKTLEESAERISKTHSVYEIGQDDFYQGFIADAKWQSERMYSEEEVIELLQWLTDDESIYSIMYGHKKYRFANNDKDFTSKEILEQFKKNKI